MDALPRKPAKKIPKPLPHAVPAAPPRREITIAVKPNWEVAAKAGMVAGTIFLLLEVLASPLTGDRFSQFPGMIARLLLGSRALPDAGFGVGPLLVAVGLHVMFSVFFAVLIARVVHPYGKVAGIAGGAVVGVLIYFVNFHFLTGFAGWFIQARDSITLVNHAIFGALAAGLYKTWWQARITLLAR